MNKKILAIVVALIVIIGTSGVLVYQTLTQNNNNLVNTPSNVPALITYELVPITETQSPNPDYYFANRDTPGNVMGYVGQATTLLLTINVTNTGDDPVNLCMENWYITQDGQLMPLFKGWNLSNWNIVSLQSGQSYSFDWRFDVEGNATDFRLCYNWTVPLPTPLPEAMNT